MIAYFYQSHLFGRVLANSHLSEHKQAQAPISAAPATTTNTNTHTGRHALVKHTSIKCVLVPPIKQPKIDIFRIVWKLIDQQICLWFWCTRETTRLRKKKRKICECFSLCREQKRGRKVSNICICIDWKSRKWMDKWSSNKISVCLFAFVN